MWDWGPPSWPGFHSVGSAKTPFPQRPHSAMPGDRTVTYLSRGTKLPFRGRADGAGRVQLPVGVSSRPS